jgi:pilus assembly protein CpaB
VLAAGPKTDRSPTAEPQNATVVTLLVSPEDAEKLALASQEGRIQLVLRNSGDAKQEAPSAIKNTNLFSHHIPHQPAKPKRGESASVQMQEIETIKGSQRENIRLKQSDSEEQSGKTPSTGK